MRWLVLALLFSSYTYSQAFIQTFTDRCTGEVKTVTINSTGQTVVAFYDQVNTFTVQDFISGAVKQWMEQVYAEWYAMSPCSTNQAINTIAQTTTQNAAPSTISIPATSASTPAPEPAPAAVETTTEAPASTENNTETTETNQTESSEQETSEDGGGSEEDSSESDGDGEESEEESSEEGGGRNPIMVAANYMAMSGIDGSFNNVVSLGFSQGSLSGVETYSANLMIWDNLKQYNLNLSKARTYFNYDKEVPVIIGGEQWGSYYEKGSVDFLQSVSVGSMYMYGTVTTSFGISNVYVQNSGIIYGYAISSVFVLNQGVTILPTIVGFGTKPFVVKRSVVTPMLAVMSNPFIYMPSNFAWNKSLTFVVGSNYDFNLTKNFRANIGLNTVKSTTNIPATYAITIGSRFQF